MIKYRKGYKYQLAEDYTTHIPIYGFSIRLKFIRLSQTGKLDIYSGYAWDGPSGPAIDTKNFMEGSLVHDVLYQLLRMQLLGPEYRLKADQILRKICIKKGMSAIRAWWVFFGVSKFAGAAANPANKKKVCTA